MVVFHAADGAVTDPAAAAGIAATMAEVQALGHVVGVTEPLASRWSVGARDAGARSRPAASIESSHV